MTAPTEVRQLVARFQDREMEYMNPAYSEARLRIDFLNPLFETLGWDVNNTANLSQGDREVLTEPSLNTETGTKFPDYIFQLDGRQVFTVEAKKPSVRLNVDPKPALQLRRYAWNSKQITVGLLSDFQELGIYDCRIPPSADDAAQTARVDYYTYDQYIDNWHEISARFSKEGVAKGGLDSYIDNFSVTKGKLRVDKLFLSELDSWRTALAVSIARSNQLEVDEVNVATQLIIDRIVFLRIAEDRSIEPYGTLRNLAKTTKPYEELVRYFQSADGKYDSGLFRFNKEPKKSEPDRLTPMLVVDGKALTPFIERLYWPDGPYDFSVLPPDVLGQVYEQFLGKQIVLKGRHRAVIEEKPEVRKSGGVYYTPSVVVKAIVQSTLGPGLAGTTPDEIRTRGFRVCDPSCGSGSFLIEVYQYLLDWHLDYYIANNPKKWERSKPPRIQKDATQQLRLTLDERKRILINHVFGVDIDAQAVEVTKLSLLLKVLEGETRASLSTQLALFNERVLPDLELNIKCGNSLVGNSFHFHAQATLDRDYENRVNAFDWEDEFPNVADGSGFDAIVGNPPWLMAGYYVADIVPYLKSNYVSATGKFDLYYLFLEHALTLLKPRGRLGMIVPNKLFHTSAARELRSLLLAQLNMDSISDFGVAQVFEGATNYSCIISGSKEPGRRTVTYEHLTPSLNILDRYSVSLSTLSREAWIFLDDPSRRLYDKMEGKGTRLEALVRRFGTGVQTGSDRLLSFSRAQAKDLGIEKSALATLLRGRDVRMYQLAEDNAKVILFPYVAHGGEWRIMTEVELKRHPNAWNYLCDRRRELGERIWFGKNAASLSGKWFGLMYLEARSTTVSPHILTPALSNQPNFALGAGSLFATGTAGVTAIVPHDEAREDIRFLLGVLNSTPVGNWILDHSPVYQGGFHKFSAPYLKGAPIPALDFHNTVHVSNHDSIVSLVDDILMSYRRLGTNPSDETAIRRRIRGAYREVDELVGELFGLSAADLQQCHRRAAKRLANRA